MRLVRFDATDFPCDPRFRNMCVGDRVACRCGRVMNILNGRALAEQLAELGLIRLSQFMATMKRVYAEFGLPT